ncbi:hypothetical protein RBG07_00110 [Klebsiella aerogenes]|uniref:hypothetical protein n=1 Tax=Klebsiella aerogenes TaxID=548 RepID=UPI0028DD79A1|nr:hypothetical protein [Klebsiella aerogenes]MDT8880965.1 hypothetical protein [Klebsiella aerogenes]
MYRLVIDTRREGKLKGISGVLRSPEREELKVITLGSILLTLQRGHINKQGRYSFTVTESVSKGELRAFNEEA